MMDIFWRSFWLLTGVKKNWGPIEYTEISNSADPV